MMIGKKRIIATIVIFCMVFPLMTNGCKKTPVTTIETNVKADKYYYVDSQNGNDENSGENPSNAWKSLTKVNTVEFKPGDAILFKAGSNWEGQLMPKGSGTAEKPIKIDMYDKGEKPALNGNGSLENDGAVVRFYNQEYWEIGNLDITNPAKDKSGRNGILIMGMDIGVLNHFYIHDCNFSDIKCVSQWVEAYYVPGNPVFDKWKFGDNIVNSHFGNYGGIAFRALKGAKDVPTAFNDIKVENNNFKNIIGAMGVTICGEWGSEWDDPSKYTVFGKRFDSTNILITNNYFDRAGYSAIHVASADGRVGDGVIVEHNTSSKAANDGSAAIMWPYLTFKSIFQFNEIYDTKYQAPDCEPFDYDGMNEGSIVQYNYTHDNSGGAVEFVYDGGIEDEATPIAYTKNNIYRYNISQNDHAIKKPRIIVTMGVQNAYIYNNIFYVGEYETQDNTMMNIWGGAKDIYFYNNIFYTELKNEKYEIGASNVVFSNNCFIGAHNETEPFDPYKITEDPKFVSKGSGEKGFTSTDGYKLKLDSPLINKGFSVPENGGRDFWGNGVYDGKTDVGAYEYSIVKNPGFEDDRKTGAEFSGWKNSYSTGEKNTASVATGGYYGKFKLVQTGKSDYSVKTEQTIDNLKTGIYDFSVVARSSGGQKTAKVVINGDETIEIPIPKTDEWITLVAKKIKVSNQNVKISIISEGSKGQWVNLDDVQLSMTDESKSLQNSGFDEYSANAENISGWQSLGTAAAKYDSTAYDGTGYALLQGTENSSINQKFTGVKDGIYDITVFSKTNGNLLNPKIVINSTTEITVPIVGSSYWKKTQIKAVNIKNSACTITISTDKSTDAKLYIDSIEISKRLTKEYYVKNPSFEKGTENWKDESSDKGVFKVTDSDSHSGSKKAVLAYSDAFIGRINQKFTNLPIDTYSVKIWAKYSGITGNAQVEISTGGKAPITEEFKKSSKYVQYILKDVIITNGVCSLSINIKGMAGNSLQIDDIEFLPIYHFSGKLTNMEFESDGLMSGKSTGWAVSGNTSAFAVESNGGAKRNTYYGLHFSNKAYQVDTYQNADNIPDGTYTLEAFVKSSGGQKEADMYVVSGKTYKKTAINKSDEWTKVKIEGIKVANGTARIGFKSNASPGQWIQFDVVEFYIMPTFLDPSFEDTAKFGKTTWSKWFNSNEMDPAIHLAKGDAHSGKQFVEFKFTQFVQGSIYQVFTDIPNGYYKLTCWVRSSGTDRRMDISVKENGSSAKVRSFKKTDVWKQYVLSNVAVYNEKMTSLIYAELNTGDWLQVDDIKIERMDRTIFDND